MFRCALLIMVFVVMALSANAQTLTEQQEQQAKNLFTQLRCVVCQNQSIADSDADVAKDLREIVREKIAEGSSNSQIKEFLVSRYGEFVLLKPNLALHTILLWFSPFIFLAFGFFWLARNRNGALNKASALSNDEQQRVDELLSK